MAIAAIRTAYVTIARSCRSYSDGIVESTGIIRMLPGDLLATLTIGGRCLAHHGPAAGLTAEYISPTVKEKSIPFDGAIRPGDRTFTKICSVFTCPCFYAI